MKKINGWSLKITFFAVLMATAGLSRGTERPYNILLIMVDDLNDWTGILGGHPQAITPNMDELAKMGTVFERAYCSAPLCNPSRASMMTGLRPSTTGVYSNPQNFRNSPAGRVVKTLPEYLSAHGYHTMSRGKIYHKPHGPIAYPETWDEWYPYDGSRMGFSEASIDRENKILAGGLPYTHAGQMSFDWGPVEMADEETSDFMAAQWAAEELNKHHDDPFFLAVGIFRPHLPFYVPQKYFDLYPDASELWMPEIDAGDLEDLPPGAADVLGNVLGESSDYQRLKAAGKLHDLVKGYLAAVSYADACVGEIIKGLKSSPYLNNTIVILSGDHGWHFGEKLRYRKNTLWERATRTTFFMRVPGMTAPGSAARSTVSLLDIYPTLLDLCGLPANDDNEGRSFRPVLENPQCEWSHPVVTTCGYKNHTVRTAQWRFIEYADGSCELYDCQSDPQEKNNLAEDAEYQDVLQKLQAELPSENARPISDGEELIDFSAVMWAGVRDGDWSVVENWTGGRVPALSDAVTISAKRERITVSAASHARSVELKAGELYIFQRSGSMLTVADDFIQSGGTLHFRTVGNVYVGGDFRATGGVVKILQGDDSALQVAGDLNAENVEFNFVWNNRPVRSIAVDGSVTLKNVMLTMNKYSGADSADNLPLLHNRSDSVTDGGFNNAEFGETIFTLNEKDWVLTLGDLDDDGHQNDIYLTPVSDR